MYRLYYSPGAASFALHWLLIFLDVPFEAVRVDIEKGEQKLPEYLAINPAGQVPTMIVDGQPQSESTALAMLLAERHADACLAPVPGSACRADYLAQMIVFANQLQPAFRAWFYPHDFSEIGHCEAVKSKACDRIERSFARLDEQLSDSRQFVLGQELTAADFIGTMLARWSRNMPRPATEWPHLGTYIDRMRSMPSLIEVHRREGLEDWIGARGRRAG